MSKRNRGFTLVELMLVVAIIGVLASLAIPGFQMFLTRSRHAEREVLVSSLKRGLLDQWASNDGRFPESAAPWGSWINAPLNPSWPVTGLKKRFDRTQWGWNKLNFDPEGFVYFHYELNAWDYPAFNFSLIQIRVFSDLDSDGIWQELMYQWERPIVGLERDWTETVFPNRQFPLWVGPDRE